jgi:hypothetical protein
MKLLKLLMIIASVVVMAFAGFLYYLGMFGKIEVSESQFGPFDYAYEEFTGPYSKTMPVFARVNSFLTSQGVISVKGIGVYFDNPSIVPAEKLRSNCGSIITDLSPEKLTAIKSKLKIGAFVASNCITTEFPVKNTLSYMMAPMKVYPIIMKYVTEKGYNTKEVYEIYDIENKKIIFVIPKYTK